MAKVTIGSIIDHYQILEQIGKGGMGVVYKALNVNLEKFVAIKTIALGLAGEDIFSSRFRTEARALARLENPHIVRIYDMRADDNQWFIVMEYVEGITLAEKIRRDKIIPWPEAFNIFQQMLTAIGHAHRFGVIHRDIKPNNIMITGEGMVKITDFGLAKDRYTRSQTLPASTGGTLYYMSPEQVKGLLFTDHRSDIYSLGLTLYEMLAGKIPFRKDDTDFTIREAIIKRQFPPPSYFNPQISDPLDSLVMKLIAKEPDDRYQDVDEIKKALFQLAQPAGQSKNISIPGDNKTAPGIGDSYFSADISSILPSQFNLRVRKNRLTDALIKYRRALIIFTLCMAALIIAMTGYPELLSRVSLRQAEKKFITSLNIITEPGSADIFINGRAAGGSPVYFDSISTDKLFISMRKNEYLPIDTLLTLEAITLNTFKVSLSPVTRAGIRVNQPGDSRTEIPDRNGSVAYPGQPKTGINQPTAEKTVDDSNPISPSRQDYIGYSQKVESDRGISISRPNSVPAAELLPTGAAIRIDSMQTYAASIPSALLSVQVSPWGSIFIDDTLKKENTNTRYRVTLPAGRHLLRVVHPVLGKLEKTIQLEANRMEEVLIDFNTIVNIRVIAFDSQGKPVWAEIIIDDKNTGELTPKEIGLHIGYHTIAAQKDGYILVNGEKEIMIENSLQEPLKFILRKIM